MHHTLGFYIIVQNLLNLYKVNYFNTSKKSGANLKLDSESTTTKKASETNNFGIVKNEMFEFVNQYDK